MRGRAREQMPNRTGKQCHLEQSGEREKEWSYEGRIFIANQNITTDLSPVVSFPPSLFPSSSHSHLLIAQAAHELTIFGRAREGGGGEVAVAAAAAQSNLLFVRSHDEPDLRAPRHMKSSSLPPPPTWRPAGWRRRRRRCKVKSSWFLGWMVLGCTRLHVEKSKELALPPPHPRSSIGVLISVGSMPIP